MTWLQLHSDHMQTQPTPRHAYAEAADSHAQKCLLVVCGLPAAGKTSIAGHLRVSPRSQVVCSCVCFDEVERSKGGLYGSEQALTFDAAAWKKARESAMSQVEQELLSATDSSQDRLVIVDDNMYYRYRHTALSSWQVEGNWP